MRDRTVHRCHYLNEENVPLSVAICEAIAIDEASRPVVEGDPLPDYLDVEAVDDLFTEAVAREEGVSVSLRMTLGDREVDVRTDPTASDEPVRIDVTDIEAPRTDD
jgi:hypothetical protein